MPDSRRVIFTTGDNIYMHDIQANATSGVVKFVGETPQNLSPSPDGRRIALAMGDFDILANHVWIFDLLPDGTAGKARQVTTSVSNEDMPAWSPDGTRLLVRHGIVYTSAIVVGRGCPELYLVPADAAAPTKVGIAGTAPGLDVTYPEGSVRNCAQARPIWLAR
jgi:dipeptidyl aminopeptidase/acylaminoacyl peptidase